MKHSKSDSQANAEALARRSSTYADQHAASWQVRFDRPTHEPKSLRGYVNELRDAYEAECPTRMHKHDVDGGGTPAFTAAFEAWLWGTPFAIDSEYGYYVTPLRATLAAMHRGEPKTQRRARIVYRIVTGMSATDAVVAEGGHPFDAEASATDALRITWNRIISAPLPKREAAA